MKRVVVLLLPLALVACSREPTEAVVVVSTLGLRVPDHLDQLRVRVSAKSDGALDRRFDQSFPLCAEGEAPATCLAFPVSFTIVPGPERADDPVLVEIDALLAGRPVIADAATFTFWPQTRLRLDFVLYESCLSMLDCGSQELTCGPDRKCVPVPAVPFVGPLDLSRPDRPSLPPADLADGAVGDLGVSEDMSPPDDLSVPPDLRAVDLATFDLVGADLTGGCGDLVKNNLETDVDCGGPLCQRCALTRACVANSDCETNNCAQLSCASGPAWLVAPTTMPSPRYGHYVAWSPSRFLVIGGVVNASTPTRLVDGYNPGTNVWSNLQDMAQVRSLFGAALAPDNRVYAIGGWSPSAANATAGAEAYAVPPTNMWAGIAATPAPARAEAGSALGADGRIYVFGGHAMPGNGTVVATTIAYTLPPTNSWAAAAPMNLARSLVAGTPGPDGRIYAIGGDDRGDSQGAVSTVEAYAPPPTNNWTAVKGLTQARRRATALLAADTRIYAIGGSIGPTGNGVTLSSVEAYTAATDSWSAVASLSTARMSAASVLGPDGRIWVFGGLVSGGSTIYNSIEVYGPRSGVAPASQQAGNTVTVGGDNFAANANVSVFLPETAPVATATGTTDAQGRLTAPITVAVPALAPGPYRLRVVDSVSRYPVTFDFTVLP